MKSAKEHYISVIIPCYNDSANLVKCLDALRRQTLDKSLYEIIVIDNGSSDNMQNAIQQYPEVSFMHEAKKGSYAARNKGITNSVGDVIAFIDSDCVPSDDWLEKGLCAILNRKNIGLIAGEVRFVVKDKDNMTGVEIWEMLYKYDQEYCVRDMNFGLTANLFTNRNVIDKVGLFNPELKSAGDYDWGNRVKSNGLNLFYDDNVVVSHPARRTLGQLKRKIGRLLGGQYNIGLINKRQCIKKILIDIFPPIVSLYRLSASDELKSLDRIDYKFKLFLLYIYVRYVTVYELTRLVLGGEPKR